MEVYVWLLIASGFQFCCIAVDELYCHRLRGLDKWEMLGHPIDSFIFAIPIAVAAFFQFEQGFYWFLAFSIVSCLIVTKDEKIHQQQCGAFESWLHSCMFILHTTVLFLVGIAWENNAPQEIFKIMLTLTLLVSFSQLLYWNIINPSKERRHDFTQSGNQQ